MLNANPFFLFIYKETCFMIIQVYDLRPFFVYIKLKEREKKKKKFYIKRSSTISDFISVSEESENTKLASLSMN